MMIVGRMVLNMIYRWSFRLHWILNRKQSPISIWMIFFDVNRKKNYVVPTVNSKFIHNSPVMLWTYRIYFWFYRPPLQLLHPPRPLLVPAIQAFVSYWERHQREWSPRPILHKGPIFLYCFWHPRCDRTKINKKRTNDALNVVSNRNLQWIYRHSWFGQDAFHDATKYDYNTNVYNECTIHQPTVQQICIGCRIKRKKIQTYTSNA
jgi:hypothetical protein